MERETEQMSGHNLKKLLDAVDTAYYSDGDHKAVCEVDRRDDTGATNITLIIDGNHCGGGKKLTDALDEYDVPLNGWKTRP